MEHFTQRGFLDFCSGLAGAKMVCQFLNLVSCNAVAEEGLSGELLKHLFVCAIVAAGDFWRRLCWDMLRPPWVLFSLVQHSPASVQFKSTASKLELERVKCKDCFDECFSHPVLNLLVKGSTEEEKLLNQEHVREILSDISKYADLSSEAAEVLHSKNRRDVYHTIGRYLGSVSCVEASFLHSCNDSYRNLCQHIDKETMPQRRAQGQIYRMMAERKTGMTSKVKRSHLKQKRRLSAWNMFQRSKMKGQSLTKVEWKSELRAAGRAWVTMDQEQRAEYKAAAGIAQHNQDTLISEPLPTREAQQGAEQALTVSKRFFHRANWARLLLNEKQKADHVAFKSQSLFDSKYSLKESHVLETLETKKEEIQVILNQLMHSDVPVTKISPAAGQHQDPHLTCHARFGFCVSDGLCRPTHALVTQFGQVLKDRAFQSGGAFGFKLISEPTIEIFYLLSVVVNKPYPKQVLLPLKHDTTQQLRYFDLLSFEDAGFVSPDDTQGIRSLILKLPSCITTADVFKKILSTLPESTDVNSVTLSGEVHDYVS